MAPRQAKDLKAANSKHLSNEAKHEEGLSNKHSICSTAMDSIYGEAVIPISYSKLDDGGGQGKINVIRWKKKGHHHRHLHDREHKTKSKAYKWDARIHQLVQDDQRAYGNGGMSAHEIAKPQGVTSDVDNGYHRHTLPEEPGKKFRVEKDANGSSIRIRQQRMPEFVSESPGGENVRDKTGKVKRPCVLHGVQDHVGKETKAEKQLREDHIPKAENQFHEGHISSKVKREDKRLHDGHTPAEVIRDVHSMSRRTLRKRNQYDGLEKERQCRVESECTWPAHVETEGKSQADTDSHELPHGYSSPNSTEALMVGSVDSHRERERKRSSRKNTIENMEMDLPPTTGQLECFDVRKEGRKRRVKKKHAERIGWEAGMMDNAYLAGEKLPSECSPHMHNPVSEHHSGRRRSSRDLPGGDDGHSNLLVNPHILIDSGQGYGGSSTGNAPETKKLAGELSRGNRPLEVDDHSHSDKKLEGSNGNGKPRQKQEYVNVQLRTCNGSSLIHDNEDELAEGLVQTRYAEPPRRPPPPVPPRISSLPNRPPPKSPPLPARCVTLDPRQLRQVQEPHVHPNLPEYEDLVASFAALRNKPTK